MRGDQVPDAVGLSIEIGGMHVLDEAARMWHDSATHMDGAAVQMPSYAELRERMDVELRTGWILYTASCGDRIVGILAIKPTEAVLDQLFVAPDTQAKGVGRQLLNRAKSQMPDGFMLRMAADNERARRFYERNGLQYVRAGVHPQSGNPVHFYEWNGS